MKLLFQIRDTESDCLAADVNMPVMQAKMRAVCILTLLDQFDPLTVLTYPVYVLDLKIIHLMLSSF